MLLFFFQSAYKHVYTQRDSHTHTNIYSLQDLHTETQGQRAGGMRERRGEEGSYIFNRVFLSSKQSRAEYKRVRWCQHTHAHTRSCVLWQNFFFFFFLLLH